MDSVKITVVNEAPELQAACLAKYSRSNLGIDAILSQVDRSDPEASVEKIFKFVDYGHASIAGLTGSITLAIDGISMYAAYRLFNYAQQADGQESSTRYIDFSNVECAEPHFTSVLEEKMWKELTAEGMLQFKHAYERLKHDIEADPSIVLGDYTNELKSALSERLIRNYALDRARYFLPFALKTNVALSMSARAWCDVLKQFESDGGGETMEIARQIRDCLSKIVPHLTKHSYAEPCDFQYRQMWEQYAEEQILITKQEEFAHYIPETYDVELHTKCKITMYNNRTSRYSTFPDAVRMVPTTFSIEGITIAELRDLNRHRNGFRTSPFIPFGFYLPEALRTSDTKRFFRLYGEMLHFVARNHNTQHLPYFLFLGTQVSFEHTQPLDKLLYELELRSDVGSHFMYRKHSLEIWERIKATGILRGYELNRFKKPAF